MKTIRVKTISIGSSDLNPTGGNYENQNVQEFLKKIPKEDLISFNITQVNKSYLDNTAVIVYQEDDGSEIPELRSSLENQ